MTNVEKYNSMVIFHFLYIYYVFVSEKTKEKYRTSFNERSKHNDYLKFRKILNVLLKVLQNKSIMHIVADYYWLSGIVIVFTISASEIWSKYEFKKYIEYISKRNYFSDEFHKAITNTKYLENIFLLSFFVSSSRIFRQIDPNK